MPDMDKQGPLVLTIDDESSIRMVFRLYLEEFGYRVIEAENGRVGLERFRERQPDLLLVDLRMPEMDGLEVLECVTKESPDTPIIIVSGTGVMDDAIQAIRLGAWDYLLKPITEPSALLHTIEKNLERSDLIRQNKEFRRRLEEKLEKIREDEEAGKKIQAKLLPPAKWQFGPFTIRQDILPSMYLSGDFVDYFEINENQAGFYCADVSGHGVSSALVTVFLKSFMVKYRDSYANKGDLTICDPAALMCELNQELLREELDKHMTLFYGVINIVENTLVFCNGGQFPYPIMDDHDHLEHIEEKGMAIGLFPFAQYHNSWRILPQKFRMTVFSDGALDFVKQGSLKDKMLFLESLKTDAAVTDFFEEAKKIDELPDDITVLSIERV